MRYFRRSHIQRYRVFYKEKFLLAKKSDNLEHNSSDIEPIKKYLQKDFKQQLSEKTFSHYCKLNIFILSQWVYNGLQGRIQGGFEGFVRTPPGWWVILHHHATCGHTSKRIVFPASATSCNLQFCPLLLFPQALSRQQADWCQPGVGPSRWTSCSRRFSAVNRRIQNYSRGGGGGGGGEVRCFSNF